MADLLDGYAAVMTYKEFAERYLGVERPRDPHPLLVFVRTCSDGELRDLVVGAAKDSWPTSSIGVIALHKGLGHVVFGAEYTYWEQAEYKLTVEERHIVVLRLLCHTAPTMSSASTQCYHRVRDIWLLSAIAGVHPFRAHPRLLRQPFGPTLKGRVQPPGVNAFSSTATSEDSPSRAIISGLPSRFRSATATSVGDPPTATSTPEPKR
jgi:hypothetical protein